MLRLFDNTKITVEFDEAGNRQQVSSGDSLKTLFGKIKKWFSDLKPVAFSGSYSDLEPKLLIHEDLNDLKLDNLGIYYGGSGNDCKNLPDNVVEFSLHVLRSAYSSVMQVLYANEEPFNVWFRVYREYKSGEGNTWGEWNFAYNRDGQKTVCDVPAGFDHKDNSLAWGTQEGEYVTAWNAGDNCSVGFRKNCPTNGKASMILDGTVYVDEGKYPVVNHNEYDKFNQVIRVGTMSGNDESCRSNPWYKVAELETNVAADDNNMTLLISTEFQSYYKYCGVIRITTRTSLDKKFEQGYIEWVFANKYELFVNNDNKWVLLHNNDNPCKCEVWTKLSGNWKNISVRLLNSSGTFDFVSKWKLINHNLNDLKTGSSSYTEGMDVINATYGNFLVGNICYDGSKRVYPMIKFIDNEIDEFGNGIAIGGGGATIIGGGESSDVIAEQFDSDHMEDGLMHGGDEKMIIANDGAIDFYTDCQNGFDTAKHISMSNGNVTANQFIGNATSASKIKSEYIPKNSDLNTYMESGIYYNGLNVETKTLTNCPTQNAFVMFVKQYGDNNIGTQEIMEYLTTNPKKYMRNFYNGTWGEWYRVYTTANKPTASEIGCIPRYIVSTATNFDNVKDEGVYCINVSGCTGLPVSNWGTVFVNPYGTKYQIFIVDQTKNIYKRSYKPSDGKWGEWINLFDTASASNIDWSNVQNKPTIPTKTSQLTNDSNFVTTSGNVASATKLATARTITIGNKSNTFNGTGNISFNLSDIGALYDNCSKSGAITINGIKFYTVMNGSTFKVVDAENICCSNGYLKVINSTGGYNGIYASQFSTQSSRRVKTNITPMTETEARKILDVDVVGYDYINGAKDQYGMIAEDVHGIIPSIVSGDVDCDDDDTEAVSRIGIDYSKAVPYLIKMVQMMEGEIRELKDELEMRDKIVG